MAFKNRSTETTNFNGEGVKNLLREELSGQAVVADTSALLMRGTDLLRSLPACDLIIPAIVAKELEGKRTSANVGFMAREWLRLLEELRVSHGEDLARGVRIPLDYAAEEITIRIEPNHSNQSVLPLQLQDGSNDSTILAVALAMRDELAEKGIQLSLISNDMPMRLHSTIELKIPAYEVSSSTVDAAKPFSGRVVVEITDEEVDEIFGSKGTDREALEDIIAIATDERISHAMVDVVHEDKIVKTVMYSSYAGVSDLPRSQNRAKGISPKTVEQRVAMSYLLKPVEELPIVSVVGRAGTGKTLLTIAAGLEGVKRDKYQKVLVFRSLHEMGAGQEMGFLPGNVEEKMGPWSGAIMDSLDVIARASRKNGDRPSKSDIDALKADVEVSPISYLRGRSITDTFMVLDEAQNFSRNELLNILSRAGEGTKIVLLADSAQVDNRFLQSGARSEVWSVVDSLKSSELFGHVTLTQTERSAVAELASDILAQ